MPSYKTVEIHVSADYELPDLYNHKDLQVNEEALTLGAFLHEQMTCRRANADVQRLEEKKEKELSHMKEQIAKIKADAAVKHADLETQLAELEDTATEKQQQLLDAQKAKDASIYACEKETIVKQHDIKIRALQADTVVLVDQKRALEARCQQLVEDRDKDIETAVERNTASFQRTLDEKDRSIQRLEDITASLKESYDSLKEKFHQFSEEHLKKTLNSRNKGAEFENILATKLKHHYNANPTFSLVENSKSSSGHEADILMNWHNKSILWEAKYYSNVVKKTEVDKFQQDMKTNPHCKIGIMMSRYTTITGKASRSDFYTERDGDQLHIYVSNSDDLGDSLYQLLPHLWQLHWESMSKNVRHEDEERDKALRMIDELIGKIAKRKTEWVGMKSGFMKGINWMADAVEADEAQLKKLLQLLKSGEKEKSTDSQWENIFVEIDDDTQKEDTIVLLKKIISPAIDGSIVLNELVGAFLEVLPEPKPSVETAKRRIRDVLAPTMIDTPKGKSIIVNGLKLNKI